VSQLKGPQAATEAAPIRNVPELPGVDTDSERRNLMADIAYGAVLWSAGDCADSSGFGTAINHRPFSPAVGFAAQVSIVRLDMKRA
jgi:hypothetical protein